MSTVSPRGQVHVDRVGELRGKRAQMKATLKAAIEKEYEERLKSIDVEISVEMNNALREGVSKTRVGKALGTSNWDTIEKYLALSASRYDETEVVAESPLAKAAKYKVTVKGDEVSVLMNVQDAGEWRVKALDVPFDRRAATMTTPLYYYSTLEALQITDEVLAEEIAEDIAGRLPRGRTNYVLIRGVAFLETVARRANIPLGGTTVEDAMLTTAADWDALRDED